MKRTAALFLLALISTDLAVAKRNRTSRGSRARAAETRVVMDASTVNDPNVWRTDAQQKSGPAILRAQILLDRANFSPGEIDASGGANLQRAITAFQQSRSLQPNGQLDEPTWQALNADTAPALVPYRLTEPDVAGPFVKVPSDLIEQSKLESLGFASALEAVAEQFHVKPALLQRLNPGKTISAGQEIMVPNVLGTVTGKAARIEVTKAGTVQAFDEAGKIIAHYPSTSGSEHDPLPIGEWKVNGVGKNPHFNYNPDLFWDADPSHTKAKIAPGPNNPVGVVWIDLSKEHYGIHGTPEPSKVGHTQSHGCIRLTNWDAMELASLVKSGTPAILKD